MKQLENKKVLITGGTTGIGRATAILLATEGADVFIFGRHEAELKEALAGIKKISGKEAIGMIADVADLSTIQAVFSQIKQRWGNLDILINNAALPARSILDHDFKEISYILKVNIEGYMICAKMALEMMLPEQKGHIINIGSMSSKIKEAEDDLYVATKAAIDGFNESLRKFITKRCIKVTIIEPGSVGTNMVTETPVEKIEAEKKELLLKAEDIAEAILFCLTRPKRCDVISLQIKPHRQII